MVLFFLFVCLFQVRAQTRTDSTRSYESHSSSTISSDAVGGNKPPPPPVKPVKPTIARQPVNQSSEDQSPGKDDEVEDPANKSFLGKVRLIYWFKWINYFLFYSYTNKAAIWGKKSDFFYVSFFPCFRRFHSGIISNLFPSPPFVFFFCFFTFSASNVK